MATTTEVECACGCGGKFFPFDQKGRVRKWLKGHQKRHNPLRDGKFIIAVSRDEREAMSLQATAEGVSVATLIRRRLGFAD